MTAPGPARSSAVVAVVVIALTVVVGAHYIFVRQALPPTVVWNLAATLGPVVLLVLSTHALGCMVLGVRAGGYESVLAFGVGCAIASFVAIVAAMLSLIRPWLLFLFLVVPFVAGRRCHRQFLSGGWRWLCELTGSSWAGVLIGAILALYCLFALSPPCWVDPLTYHLVIPRDYLAHGGIPPASDSCPTSFFPPAMSMLYLYLMARGTDLGPKLLHFGFLLAMVAVLDRNGRRWFGVDTTRLAVLLFLGEWSVCHGVQRANVDFHYSFYALTTLVLLVERWLGEDRRHWALIVGCCMGTAMASKLTSISVIVAAELLLLVLLKRRAVTLETWMVVNGTALLVFLPCLVRNALWTGDPLFWFLSKRLGTYGVMARAQLDAVASIHACTVPPRSLGFVLLGPLFTYVYGTFPSCTFDGFLAPLYLVALPLALVTVRRERWFAPTALAVLAFYLVWILTIPRIRHILPILPLISLVGLASLRNALTVQDERLRRWLYGCLAVVVAAIVTTTCFRQVYSRSYYVANNLPAFLGIMPRATFLEGTPAADWLYLERHMGANDEAVFCVLATQSYYSQRPVTADPTYTNLAVLQDVQQAGGDPVEWLRRRGYRWLVYDRTRYGWIANDFARPHPLLNPTEEGLAYVRRCRDFVEQFVSSRLPLRYETPRLQLYDLREQTTE